jgi:hypothetical protein
MADRYERWKTMEEILAEAADPPPSFTPEQEWAMMSRARLMRRLDRVTHDDTPRMSHVVVVVGPLTPPVRRGGGA